MFMTGTFYNVLLARAAAPGEYECYDITIVMSNKFFFIFKLTTPPQGLTSCLSQSRLLISPESDIRES